MMNEPVLTAPPVPVVPDNLHILSAKPALLSQPLDVALPSTDPSHLPTALTWQLSQWRKQKFKFLELNAKDRYIKTIVSDTDDAPLVTTGTNDALSGINQGKKVVLKEAKERLQERQEAVRKLAPLVEQAYEKATNLTTRYSTLTTSTLNARLSVTRLRQTYPPPRISISGALAHLDAQSSTLQTLDEELSSLRRKITTEKDRLKEKGRELERLRTERAEITKAVREQGEESSLVPVYDWYTNSLALHRSMHDLISFEKPSENEMHLTYHIPAWGDKGSGNSAYRFKVTLLFHPNTRLLASASCNPPLDITDLLEWGVESNDVSGFLCAVLQLAKSGCGGHPETV